MGLLTIAYIFSFIDRYVLGLLIEPIKADLGLTDTQIGLLLGPAFAIFYATMGLPLGWLADRKNRVKIVVSGSRSGPSRPRPRDWRVTSRISSLHG
ncbi:MAG: hypothetical protein CM15mP103_04080 [Gammaproteobacteria bacterium]|nr:MAG: hypothetical protein CM15mP103_04080 [Gammaproteobacteria bacterium]